MKNNYIISSHTKTEFINTTSEDLHVQLCIEMYNAGNYGNISLIDIAYNTKNSNDHGVVVGKYNFENAIYTISSTYGGLKAYISKQNLKNESLL